MRTCRTRRLWLPLLATALALSLSSRADAACCYFSAQNADILQPAQKVFITWDPVKQLESFTVQPKFEGNALDFGMVIPTPTQPKLHEMPRDFFKHLAVYSILKKREFPHSKLLPIIMPPPPSAPAFNGPGKGFGGGGINKKDRRRRPRFWRWAPSARWITKSSKRPRRRPVCLAESQQVQLLRR